ncbi:MAG: penicillin-binding transpeptidase domain-containing protein [Planctomycetota bacterium]
MTLNYRRRLALLLVLGGGGGLLLLLRLFFLQVLEHERWSAQAAAQVAGWRPIHARRGRILDVSGAELARDEAGFDLTVRAAAWVGHLFECAACGFHRYYRLEAGPAGDRHGTRTEPCPRCRARELVYADRRDVGRVAALLGLAPGDLRARVERRVRDTHAWVQELLGKLSPKLREHRWPMLWADHGWRPRRIARNVPYEVAREVELHPQRNPAFRIRAVPTRRTPGGRPFVHLVGRVRQERKPVTPPDGSQDFLTIARGLSGLEARYDPELRGEAGWVKILRDPRGQERKVVERHRPVPGLDLHLTLAVQDQERALLALHGVTGAFVVIDAGTGAVLALASSPGYEPGDHGRIFAELTRVKERTGRWPRHHALREAACSDFYAPGSLLKPFTAVAALAAGVARPSTAHVCEHYFSNRRGQVIRDSLKCNGTHGSLDLHGALVQSCNIYFQTLMREMIEAELFPRFEETGRRFGFGRPTGAEIEPRRFTDTFEFGESWAEWIMCAIGQSRIRLSPAQIARAYAGLATGFLPRLHLVAQVGDVATVPRREPLGVAEAALAPVRAALREVPRRGTARGYRLERWGIACKTGTAQRKQGYNAWLAGFAPARKPRPAIAFAMVVLDTPLHGAEACGPRLEEFFRYFYEEASQ